MRFFEGLGIRDLGFGRKKTGRGNWFLMFLVFVIGMAVLVVATAPSWINGASSVNYTIDEGSIYVHNLSANITGFNNDVTFAITTVGDSDIFWTNSTGTYSVEENVISSWISVTNVSTGEFTINATYDNQTGFFVIPIKAINTSDAEGTITNFEFMINATNDAPNFTDMRADRIYNFTQGSLGIHNFSALDEELQYPLNFNLSFFSNCSHANWAGVRDNCSLFDLIESSPNASISWTPVAADVGTYWANITVNDTATVCPHDYCNNDTYNVNQTSDIYLVKFNVFSSLSINATNCTDIVLTEAVQYNCTINITTDGAADSLDISTNGSFRTDSSTPYNISWFYPDVTASSSDFIYSVDVVVNASKRDVGNWSINFSVVDTTAGTSTYELINMFVNYTEADVVLETIADLSGANKIYEDYVLQVNATDGDLWVRDGTVKEEMLVFAANESWITFVTNSNVTLADANYTTANFSIDVSAATAATHAVLINVTDVFGNSDEQVVIIEVDTDAAPVWDVLTDSVLMLTEDAAFSYNVSVNVSDADGDSMNFSYINVSGEFCSLNSTNFNLTTGMISFTPTDCDVGYHNVTINADDGKINSSMQFNFTISNVVDAPTITSLQNSTGALIANASTYNVSEDGWANFTLVLSDYDFLIPSGQSAFYSESLTVNIITTNITSGSEIDDLFSFVEGSNPDETISYSSTFQPASSHVGNYTIYINISDAGGGLAYRVFTLNVTASNDEPILTAFDNQSSAINETFYLDINATDEEDDLSGSLLNYSISNLTVSGDFLTINLTTGVINFTLNDSHVGIWDYNVLVNDSDGLNDSQNFTLTVYGVPNITEPVLGYVFNWSEANATGNLEFNVSYAINNTNLTYDFYLDRIVYSNATAFNYTTLLDSASLRNSSNYTWVGTSNLSWNFTPGYSDESYGLLKNLTLVVYHPDYPTLNSTVNWKVNVTHENQNVTFISGAYITDKGPATYGTAIEINLSEYFEDVDYWDNNISQTVNFTLTAAAAGYIVAASSFDDWILSLDSPTTTTEILTITANEYNSSNVSIGSAASNSFQVEFIAPSVTTVTTPSSGGSSVQLKYFSLKLITPEDVIVSAFDYIDVFFSVQNDGAVDLSGIDLSSFVEFGNSVVDDISISLEEDRIDSLKIGESKEFSMRISANTQVAGRYKATLLANVTSPKFSDWGEFFIELRKANESEAEQILVFTHKMVAENPECLELTELLVEAEQLFESGDYSGVVKKTQEVVEACESAIEANEQIRYHVAGFVKDNFYYISFATLFVFLGGFIFYVYKRVRFNKSRVDEYV